MLQSAGGTVSKGGVPALPCQGSRSQVSVKWRRYLAECCSLVMDHSVYPGWVCDTYIWSSNKLFTSNVNTPSRVHPVCSVHTQAAAQRRTVLCSDCVSTCKVMRSSCSSSQMSTSLFLQGKRSTNRNACFVFAHKTFDLDVDQQIYKAKLEKLPIQQAVPFSHHCNHPIHMWQQPNNTLG